jgi:phosphoribosylpyrophosphate synthetase
MQVTQKPINQDDVRFFSGRSNPILAKKIADNLEIKLEETHISRFSNDNLFVQLGASVRGRVVYIVQSLVPPVSDHLVELLMMLDIAKSAAAREVHAVIPYFSYARSDKKDAPRISITARLVADLLATSGATHVMTMQLHSPQVHGFFSMPADPLTARGLFANYFKPRNYTAEDTVVVAPEEISLVCSHGLFLGNALERIAEIPQIREIVTTDTVPRDERDKPDNMVILSTAPVFGGAIRQNYYQRSIGELFDFGHGGIDE